MMSLQSKSVPTTHVVDFSLKNNHTSNAKDTIVPSNANANNRNANSKADGTSVISVNNNNVNRTPSGDNNVSNVNSSTGLPSGKDDGPSKASGVVPANVRAPDLDTTNVPSQVTPSGPVLSPTTKNVTTATPTTNTTVPTPTPTPTPKRPGPLDLVGNMQRKRAVEFLEEFLKEHKITNTTAEQIEQTCYEVTKGLLKDYLSCLCHEKVRMQQLLDTTREVGKKRKLDEHFYEPMVKKRKVAPYFQWYYLSHDNGLKSRTKTTFSDNAAFEANFLARKGPFKHEIQGKQCEIDTENMTIDGEPRLRRYLFVLGQKFKPDAYWIDRQPNLFHSFDLDDKESPMYFHIADMFFSSLPNARINSIKQLQHVVNFKRYQIERTSVALNSEVTGEKLLFFGSNFVIPRALILEHDGFDWRALDTPTRGVPFHKSAKEADKNAYLIRNPADIAKDGVRKQMLVALVSTGRTVPMAPSEVEPLKRPPVRAVVNNMNQHYDSVKINQPDLGNTTYYIYHKSQAYPAFLIDYTVPTDPISSFTF